MIRPEETITIVVHKMQKHIPIDQGRTQKSAEGPSSDGLDPILKNTENIYYLPGEHANSLVHITVSLLWNASGSLSPFLEVKEG